MSYLSPETEIYSWLLGVESAVMRAIAVGQSFLHTSGVAATHLGVYSLFFVVVAPESLVFHRSLTFFLLDV